MQEKDLPEINKAQAVKQELVKSIIAEYKKCGIDLSEAQKDRLWRTRIKYLSGHKGFLLKDGPAEEFTMSFKKKKGVIRSLLDNIVKSIPRLRIS